MRDERRFILWLEVDAITDDASWAEWEALGDALAGRLPGEALEQVAEQLRRWAPAAPNRRTVAGSR